VIKLKIKKGATVQVISGSDKGKKGTVLAVNSAAMKIQVQGVKIQTHFDKKDGLLKKEGFIDYSNVKLLDAPTKEKKTSKKAAKSKTA
jgi:large subunit ribosomal protein L24